MRIHIVLFSLTFHFPVLGGGSGVVDVDVVGTVVVVGAGVEVVVDLVVVGRVVVVDEVVVVVEGVFDIVKITVDGMSVFDIELFSVFSSFEEIECIFVSSFTSG